MAKSNRTRSSKRNRDGKPAQSGAFTGFEQQSHGRCEWTGASHRRREFSTPWPENLQPIAIIGI
jgi:hypothetical protein